jgi:UPF0271 protein
VLDLNADLGEGFPWDDELLGRISSACVCCGAHAGGEAVIRATLRSARAHGVVVGAHPGFPDRAGFGRRERSISAAEAEDLVREQVHVLCRLAEDEGVVVAFLKPHGALYNQAQRDPEVALGVVSAARGLSLPILGLPGRAVAEEAGRQGVRFVSEGFVDRRYTADGRLVSRSQPDAVLSEPSEVAAQALRLLDLGLESLCLHGDEPQCVSRADLLLATLHRAGVEVGSFMKVSSER